MLVSPPPAMRWKNPNGLLAIGGDLSPARLLAASHSGIFPWNEPHQPLLWWYAGIQGVIVPDELHIGRSLQKYLRRTPFDITIDHAFDEVIAACAAPRRSASGTWISAPMIDGLSAVSHRLGHAHSVGIWQDGQLQAGLYGLSLGRLFCGESMFSRIDNGARTGHGGALSPLRTPWRCPHGLPDAERLPGHPGSPGVAKEAGFLTSIGEPDQATTARRLLAAEENQPMTEEVILKVGLTPQTPVQATLAMSRSSCW